MSIFNSQHINSLSQSWSDRKKQMEREKMLEYADMLADFVLERVDIPSTTRKLYESIATAKNKKDLKVPIFGYNYRQFNTTQEEHRKKYDELPVEEQESFAHAKSMQDRRIDARGWNYRIGTKVDGVWIVAPKSLHAIIGHTDVLEQIAVRFGPNFTCSFERTFPNTVVESTFGVHGGTIVLQYWPDGLKGWVYDRRRRLVVREPRLRDADENVFVTNGDSKTHVDPPGVCTECFDDYHHNWCSKYGDDYSVIQRRGESGCYCGCGDESE